MYKKPKEKAYSCFSAPKLACLLQGEKSQTDKPLLSALPKLTSRQHPHAKRATGVHVPARSICALRHSQRPLLPHIGEHRWQPGPESTVTNGSGLFTPQQLVTPPPTPACIPKAPPFLLHAFSHQWQMCKIGDTAHQHLLALFCREGESTKKKENAISTWVTLRHLRWGDTLWGAAAGRQSK